MRVRLEIDAMFGIDVVKQASVAQDGMNENRTLIPKGDDVDGSTGERLLELRRQDGELAMSIESRGGLLLFHSVFEKHGNVDVAVTARLAPRFGTK